MPDEPEKIRITLDDLEHSVADSPAPVSAPQPALSGAPRQWGTITGSGPATPTTAATKAGSFFLKGWVYLSLAGIVGAFLAWALCEPWFDEHGGRWGNLLIFPLLITFMSMGFAAAESIVERSMQKAVIRGLLALGLGLVLGFIFYFIANVIYSIGIGLLIQKVGKISPGNPALWFVRAIAWIAFGICGGLVYGIVGKSGKKCAYGILGGMLGAGVGGLIFDPVSLLTGGAEASRAIGMTIFGASTGLAIGLVESALKDRWLYVSGGPLAGKQFILYKAATQIGSLQTSDIYLFKDTTIQPLHASIELRGIHAVIIAIGPTFVGGQPVSQQALRSGDLIQIGRYSFQYQEKHRA